MYAFLCHEIHPQLSEETSTKDFHQTFYVWWKRGGRIKKWSQSARGTSNHRRFHIIFFHLNSRLHYSCKQTANGKWSHPYRYSFVMRSVCRFLRQKLSGPPCLTLCAQRGGVHGEAKLLMFPWLFHESVIDAVQRLADGWVLVANTVQALIPAWPGVKGRW